MYTSLWDQGVRFGISLLALSIKACYNVAGQGSGGTSPTKSRESEYENRLAGFVCIHDERPEEPEPRCYKGDVE